MLPRKWLSFAGPAFLLLISVAAFAQGAKVSANSRAPLKENERDDPEARARWFMRGRTVNGTPGAAQLRRAYAQKLNNRRLRALQEAQRASARVGAVAGSPTPQAGAAAPSAANLPSNGISWNPVPAIPPATTLAVKTDPSQDYGLVVGRATSVVVDQCDTTGNTVYLGGASGGLWKSTNAANSTASQVLWTPLTDDQATLAIGAIALQPPASSCTGPSQVIVAGTGEANNSADSYYGLGFLISSNAGGSWTLVDHATGTRTVQCNGSSSCTIPLHGLGVTHMAFSTDNTGTVVAATAAASGGIQVGAETGGGNLRGLYYSVNAGTSWTYATLMDGSTLVDPGSTTAVIYNPVVHKFFAAARYHGFYSSSDGITWNRLSCQPGDTVTNGVCASNSGMLNATACPAVLSRGPTGNITTNCPLYRAELAIVRNPDGTYRNEMYTWMVNSATPAADLGIFQSLDGGATWTSISTSGLANCGDGLGCDTEQGTYNLTLAGVPNGQGTDLYAGAVNEYKCTLTGTPPSPGTCSFVNLTHVYGCTPTASLAHVHPDEHGIDYSFTNPQIIFFAHDGGVSRTLSGFTLNSGSCSVPNPFDNLNTNMGSMLQFVSFSQHPTDDTTLLGGTQDNGSPAASSALPSNSNWIQVLKSDGGFNEINPTNPTEWFAEYPAIPPSNLSIFRCTSGINCTDSLFNSNRIVSQANVGGDFSPFYTVYKLDPQTPDHIFVGTCRVWRNDRAASAWNGTALTSNLDVGGATVCAKGANNMISALDAGGPTTGNGSQVIYAGTEGTPADPTNGIVGSGGQLWMTTNADGGTGTWVRVDGGDVSASVQCTATPSRCNINPKFYNISDIAVDRSVATGKTAYVTVMGFGVSHLLKTTDGGSTWAVLDGDPNNLGLPDAPADAVTIDPINPGTVYVASDVGVFAYSGGAWTELGTGGSGGASGSLPNVATTRLRVFNNAGTVKLRVSTYGRGIWETALATSTAPSFTMSISNPVQTVPPGQTATYNGTITTQNGYNSSITISCVAGTTNPPSTCTPSPATIANPQTSPTFTITASDPQAKTSAFLVQAVGSDAGQTKRQIETTLDVFDFTLSAPSPSNLTILHDAAQSTTLTVSPVGGSTGPVTLSCTGLPADVICAFPGGNPVLVNTSTTVTVQVKVGNVATPGTYAIAIAGTFGSLTHSQPLNVTVSSNTADFTIGATNAVAVPQSSATVTVTLTPQNGYDDTVVVSCPTVSGMTCAPATSSADLSTGTKTVVETVTVPQNQPPGPYVFNITGTDQAASLSHTAAATVNVTDFTLSVAAPTSVTVKAGAAPNPSFAITVTPQNGFSGTVNFTTANCPTIPANSCSFSPASVTLAGAAQTTTLTVTTIAATVAQAQPPRRPGGAPLYALWLGLPGIALGWVGVRGASGRRRGWWLGLGLLLGLLLVQVACGGGGGSTTPPPPTPVPGTPAGTYNITVTATSTAPVRTQSTPVTVVVN